jgi:hypothetical protein
MFDYWLILVLLKRVSKDKTYRKNRLMETWKAKYAKRYQRPPAKKDKIINAILLIITEVSHHRHRRYILLLRKKCRRNHILFRSPKGLIFITACKRSAACG